ncbi:MAG: dihydropteroate synthase [Bacteroidota bacterium]
MSNSNLFGVEVKHFRSNHTFRLRNKLVSLKEPLIMAIVNATPDSYHPESRLNGLKHLDIIAQNCLKKNVRIVDIGAHSTRPGYTLVSSEEQIARLKPYIQHLRKKYSPLYISVDTSDPLVARFALENGADLINDVEGGRNHPDIYNVCAEFNAPYILVHSRGSSEDLHAQTSYDNVTTDVMFELSCQVEQVKASGVKDIILDLGFGFSKTVDENFELLNNLKMFQLLGYPILCGISRKSMIYRKINTSSENALNGTTVLNTFALIQHANFLRVHDIDQAHEIIELLKIP